MRIKPQVSSSQLRVLYTGISALLIIAGAAFAIGYAKGNYRFTSHGIVEESGLLSANSSPTGAQVLIDDKLITATDDTLYLEPGEYQVKIVKDGYTPWQKKLKIEKELVAQTNALLFPSAASLTPLTFTGASNISPSPDGQKIIYYTHDASTASKNGLYLLEISGNFLPLQKNSQQLSTDVTSWDLENADFIWSPDSSKVMLIANDHRVMLSLDKEQQLAALPDVGLRKKQILSQWENEMYLRERQFLVKFPEEIVNYATTSAKNVYLSPDKKKMLYTSLVATTLPNDIIPPIPATNTQPEERQLEPGGIYIYDSEEDKNFRIGTQAIQVEEESLGAEDSAAKVADKHLLATDLYTQPLDLSSSPSAFTTLQATSSAQTAKNFNDYHTSIYPDAFQWFPDSNHVIYLTGKDLKIKEYDGTNETTLYSGQMSENFIYPWPNGKKIVILTSFSPSTPQNLYAIELER